MFFGSNRSVAHKRREYPLQPYNSLDRDGVHLFHSHVTSIAIRMVFSRRRLFLRLVGILGF
jgi:hypothetical protein